MEPLACDSQVSADDRTGEGDPWLRSIRRELHMERLERGETEGLDGIPLRLTKGEMTAAQTMGPTKQKCHLIVSLVSPNHFNHSKLTAGRDWRTARSHCWWRRWQPSYSIRKIVSRLGINLENHSIWFFKWLWLLIYLQTTEKLKTQRPKRLRWFRK